jgi:hypothetical protein
MKISSGDNGPSSAEGKHERALGSGGFAWNRGTSRGCWQKNLRQESARMDSRIAIALYVLVLIGVIVGVDVAFFRNRFWERLLSNIGIALLFAAFYLRFLRNG